MTYGELKPGDLLYDGYRRSWLVLGINVMERVEKNAEYVMFYQNHGTGVSRIIRECYRKSDYCRLVVFRHGVTHSPGEYPFAIDHDP